MKIFKNILLVCLGFVAWVQIQASQTVPLAEHPLSWFHFVQAAILIVSIAYLHWCLRTYLMPFRHLTEPQAQRLRAAYLTKYEKSFFAGTVGFGYFLVILEIFATLARASRGGDLERTNLIGFAMLLIVIGVLTQARAAVQHLSAAYASNNTKGTEQAN